MFLYIYALITYKTVPLIDKKICNSYLTFYMCLILTLPLCCCIYFVREDYLKGSHSKILAHTIFCTLIILVTVKCT